MGGDGLEGASEKDGRTRAGGPVVGPMFDFRREKDSVVNVAKGVVYLEVRRRAPPTFSTPTYLAKHLSYLLRALYRKILSGLTDIWPSGSKDLAVIQFLGWVLTSGNL